MESLTASTESLPVHPPEPDDRPLLDASDDGHPPSTASNTNGDGAAAGVPDPSGAEDPILHKSRAHSDSSSSPLQSGRCGCATSGMNLVVCIDGTSNEFGMKITNVLELYGLLPKAEMDRQRGYYHSGIGTQARSIRTVKSLAYYRNILGRTIDLAIAWSFESIILDAYRWLSENYQTGDRVFLFGFSRGAYQVRTLSAMVDKVGLIHPNNEWQIPLAYQLYTDTYDGAIEPSVSLSDRSIPLTRRFTEVFSRFVKVHFVGAWDTVSSVGFARTRKLLPGTVEGMHHVCYFRHALALDERRVKFLPEYARGGAGPPRPQVGLTAFNDTQEVWFAGTHSDIGGGNVETDNLHNPAFRWMYSSASVAGLRLRPFTGRTPSRYHNVEVSKSLTWKWWPLEYLTLKRLAYRMENKGKDTTRRPHRGEGRIIQEGQKIHPSVWLSEELNEAYKPRAQYPSDQEFWYHLKLIANDEPLADGTYSSPWKGVDLYDMVEYLFKQYINIEVVRPQDSVQRAQLDMMHIHARSEEGRRALLRELVQRLQLVRSDIWETDRKPVEGPVLCSVFCVILESSNDRPERKLGLYTTVRSRMLRHLVGINDDERRIAQDFLDRFTDTVQVLTGHTRLVSSVAFSPNGKRIVSGSWDDTIRIWDAETGQAVGEPLKEHAGDVNSVASSPDGTRIVSGSDDKTVRIWDAETGQAVEKPLEGHTSAVRSVAFSPDGTRIVSGSDDDTLRIWDAETGQAVGEPLKGHTNTVWSVAFSPDGKHIVSGSSDNTIRIWDAETRQAVGKPLEGHTDTVWSVAFSPDGTGIVSGSDDKTVRIWDAETGQAVGEPLKGHSGRVLSVAFSPDGTRIVSGSGDETIRIWDAETGQAVRDPLEGHTNSVWSVAFSPDGTRIVSGSSDRTVRIWDLLQEPV